MLFTKELYYLLKHYRQIGFADLFNVAILTAHVNMPCIIFTDKSQSSQLILTVAPEHSK